MGRHDGRLGNSRYNRPARCWQNHEPNRPNSPKTSNNHFQTSTNNQKQKHELGRREVRRGRNNAMNGKGNNRTGETVWQQHTGHEKGLYAQGSKGTNVRYVNIGNKVTNARPCKR